MGQAAEFTGAHEPAWTEHRLVKPPHRGVCGRDHVQFEVLAEEPVADVQQIAHLRPAVLVTRQEQVLRVFDNRQLGLGVVPPVLVQPEAHEIRGAEHLETGKRQVVEHKAVDEPGHQHLQIAGLAYPRRAEEDGDSAVAIGESCQPLLLPRPEVGSVMQRQFLGIRCGAGIDLHQFGLGAVRPEADEVEPRFRLLEWLHVPAEVGGHPRRRLRGGGKHGQVAALVQHEDALPQAQQQALNRRLVGLQADDLRPVEVLAVVVGQPPGVEWTLHLNPMVRPLPEVIEHRQVEEGGAGVGEDAPFEVSGGGYRPRLVIVQQFRAADEGVRRRFQFRE